jgi:hypothetical protein
VVLEESDGSRFLHLVFSDCDYTTLTDGLSSSCFTLLTLSPRFSNSLSYITHVHKTMERATKKKNPKPVFSCSWCCFGVPSGISGTPHIHSITPTHARSFSQNVIMHSRVGEEWNWKQSGKNACGHQAVSSLVFFLCRSQILPCITIHHHYHLPQTRIL